MVNRARRSLAGERAERFREAGNAARQEKWMTPYYEHAGITIYHGDCRTILMSLPSDSVGLVLTDPPYSQLTHAKQWVGADLTGNSGHRGIGFEALTPPFRAFMAMQARRMCPRWSLFFADLEGIDGWREAVQVTGLEYVRTAIWDKVDSAPQFTGDRPASSAEAIICAHPSGAKRWNGGGRRNVFRHAVNGVKGDKPHPTTKPELLIRELIGLFSDPGETVIDFTMGSGTTLRAAKDLGRRAIGIEIEEKYCEIAVERLRQETIFGVTA